MSLQNFIINISKNMKNLILFIIIMFCAVENSFSLPEDSDRVTVIRTSLRNSECAKFMQRCLETDPNFYRYTILKDLEHRLSAPSSSTSQEFLATVCAYDEGLSPLGWYKIEETDPTGKKGKQIAGLLSLEGDLETGFVEVHLLYLPRSLFFSQESLTPQVLRWAKAQIEPHLTQSIPFLSEIDKTTFKPVFAETAVQGICATISCWNYPSLITTTRAGFKVACLVSPSLRGHEYCLVYSPTTKTNPAIEEYVKENSGMSAFIFQAQKGLDLLENRESREQGKRILKNIYYTYSNIYRIARVGIGGVPLILWTALKYWNQ